MNNSFGGGIRPPEHKHITADKPAVTIKAPEKVVIPLIQHIGEICTPLVKAGDRVLLGQKIGDVNGLGAPIHASVSGIVKAVEERPHQNGSDVLSVIIENDMLDMPQKKQGISDRARNLTADELIRIVREAGIVGMGGAAFPTDKKLISGLGAVDTVIANACECEPYVTCDDALLRSFPEQVTGGLGTVARILSPKRIVIAIEDNKPQAIDAIKLQAKNCKGIEVVVLNSRYPQGAEKQLIKAVTGREVPSGKLPKDAGCLVLNAATCAAIYKAVHNGEPVIDRMVSVTGDAIKAPANYIVRIGTSFQHLIECAGGVIDASLIIAGGPMMGVTVSDVNVSVMKGTNSVLCLKSTPEIPENPICIRCGRCVEACPVNLMPLMLNRAVLENSVRQMRTYNLMDCIGCGCCVYVCPGKIPLVQRFRRGKSVLKEKADSEA